MKFSNYATLAAIMAPLALSPGGALAEDSESHVRVGKPSKGDMDIPFTPKTHKATIKDKLPKGCKGENVIVEELGPKVVRFWCYNTMIHCNANNGCKEDPYGDPSKRGEGRKLDSGNTKWLDLKVYNSYSKDRPYYIDLIPGDFWENYPDPQWHDNQDNDYNSAYHETPHPNYNKGSAMGMYVHGDSSVTMYNDIRLQSGVSNADATVRWIGGYEYNNSGDVATITIMGSAGETIALNNPEAICSGATKTLTFSATAGLSKFVSAGAAVSAAFNPCGGTYVTCGSMNYIETEHGTQPFVSCTMTLQNNFWHGTRAFYTGVTVS